MFLNYTQSLLVNVETVVFSKTRCYIHNGRYIFIFLKILVTQLGLLLLAKLQTFHHCKVHYIIGVV